MLVGGRPAKKEIEPAKGLEDQCSFRREPCAASMLVFLRKLETKRKHCSFSTRAEYVWRYLGLPSKQIYGGPQLIVGHRVLLQQHPLKTIIKRENWGGGGESPKIPLMISCLAP